MAKILLSKIYYSDVFIDHSRSMSGEPTGNNHATIVTRTYWIIRRKDGKKIVKSARGVVSARWETDEDKPKAIVEAVQGMTPLKELDENPPLDFIPGEIENMKQKL
jgi:hypothetical protein